MTGKQNSCCIPDTRPSTGHNNAPIEQVSSRFKSR
eukprot:CAMPEP_0118804894 /NCGR_PEP_ID=MMETSP1161-20130426/25065_1 /TAXON_ID=249345 /ORGANISM="Picochlorum oklahomensis, Strain CCMP2329" /LENGTH=34 /DNA_ID= /DNA_START= /DNA_END= /DNA_ORIENTATION=